MNYDRNLKMSYQTSCAITGTTNRRGTGTVTSHSGISIPLLHVQPKTDIRNHLSDVDIIKDMFENDSK